MSKFQQFYHNPHVHKLNANAAWGKVNKPNGVLTIKYNALDQKISQSTSRNDSIVSEYFVYDPSGNVLATYGDTIFTTNGHHRFSLHQLTIYGSSRIGLLDADSLLWKDGSSNVVVSNVYTQKLGLKRYELSNHLGNVSMVVSDRKLVDSHSNGQITAWKADVISVSDYYPFGMKITERSWPSDTYRFGFNGKDFFSDWNRQDYGFRIYDDRKCRFESVDPLKDDYPELTTYQFASNTPIAAIDLDGAESQIVSIQVKQGSNHRNGKAVFYKLDKVGPLGDVTLVHLVRIGFDNVMYQDFYVSNMKFNDFTEFVKAYEGTDPKHKKGGKHNIYKDSKGYPTIGYGHLLSNNDKKSGKYKNGISETEALNLLEKDVLKHRKLAEKSIEGFNNLAGNEQEALTDLYFNALKNINYDDDESKSVENPTGFFFFDHLKEETIRKRRVGEYMLYATGVYLHFDRKPLSSDMKKQVLKFLSGQGKFQNLDQVQKEINGKKR